MLVEADKLLPQIITVTGHRRAPHRHPIITPVIVRRQIRATIRAHPIAETHIVRAVAVIRAELQVLTAPVAALTAVAVAEDEDVVDV